MSEGKHSYDVDIKVNREEIQDSIDEIDEAINKLNMPNITIRNNQNVYVTINNFNTSHEQYLKEEVKE